MLQPLTHRCIYLVLWHDFKPAGATFANNMYQELTIIEDITEVTAPDPTIKICPNKAGAWTRPTYASNCSDAQVTTTVVVKKDGITITDQSLVEVTATDVLFADCGTYTVEITAGMTCALICSVHVCIITCMTKACINPNIACYLRLIAVRIPTV